MQRIAKAHRAIGTTAPDTTSITTIIITPLRR